MALDAEVQAALVAAATSLLILGGEKVWNHWIGRREQRRQTQIQYLYPLKVACDDLLEYWSNIRERIKGGESTTVTEPFLKARDTCFEPTFYRHCNDHLCGPIGTMYATACYFAYAAKLREQLPLVRISQRTALRLLEATDDVRIGLGSGDKGAFWAEIQDSIGRLVTTDTGRVVPCTTFCRALSKDFDSYFRLFNFYIDIVMKYHYQLTWAYEALTKLQKLLDRILRTPYRAPGTRSHPSGRSTPLAPAATPPA